MTGQEIKLLDDLLGIFHIMLEAAWEQDENTHDRALELFDEKMLEIARAGEFEVMLLKPEGAC
jgi:hypothetical protein